MPCAAVETARKCVLDDRNEANVSHKSRKKRVFHQQDVNNPKRFVVAQRLGLAERIMTGKRKRRSRVVY